MAGEPGGAGSSRLFLLRLWTDTGGWRGRLQDLASGEAWSFAGWPELSELLLDARVHSSCEVESTRGVSPPSGSSEAGAVV